MCKDPYGAGTSYTLQKTDTSAMNAFKLETVLEGESQYWESLAYPPQEGNLGDTLQQEATGLNPRRLSDEDILLTPTAESEERRSLRACACVCVRECVCVSRSAGGCLRASGGTEPTRPSDARGLHEAASAHKCSRSQTA